MHPFDALQTYLICAKLFAQCQRKTLPPSILRIVLYHYNRSYASKVFVVGGRDAKLAFTDTVFQFNEADQKWTKHPTRCPFALASCKSALAYNDASGRNTILTAGGKTAEGATTRECFVLSIPSNEGEATTATASVGNTVVPRRCHGLVALRNGQILALGGQGPGSSRHLSSIERYHRSTNRWELCKEKMLRARSEFCAVVLGDGVSVFIIGGWDGHYSQSCEMLDSNTGRFVVRASMTTSRRNHAAVVLPFEVDGKEMVLVSGGYNRTNAALATCEMYCVASNTWTGDANLTMAERRTSHGMAVLSNNSIIVVGGWNGNTTLASCEMMDGRLSRWVLLAGQMPQARAYASVI